MFTYFKNAVSNSQPTRDYIQSGGLSSQLTEIGYNSGQFHHGERKDEQLINVALQYGLLRKPGQANRLIKPLVRAVSASHYEIRIILPTIKITAIST
jgi:hypothetical protein